MLIDFVDFADFAVLLDELDLVVFFVVDFAESAEASFAAFVALDVFGLGLEAFEEVSDLAVFFAAVFLEVFLTSLDVDGFAAFADFVLVDFDAALVVLEAVAFLVVFAEEALAFELFDEVALVEVAFLAVAAVCVVVGFFAAAFFVAEVVFFAFDVDVVFDVESAFFEVGTSNPFDGA